MTEPTPSKGERSRDSIHDAGLTSASQRIPPCVATPLIMLDPELSCDPDRHLEGDQRPPAAAVDPYCWRTRADEVVEPLSAAAAALRPLRAAGAFFACDGAPYRWRAASPDVPIMAPIVAQEWPAALATAIRSLRRFWLRARSSKASRTARSATPSVPATGSASSKRRANSSAWARISSTVRGMGIT